MNISYHCGELRKLWLGEAAKKVRSKSCHRIVRPQPGEPRPHHCRPEARVDRLRRLSAASAGRLPAPVVAGQRIWLMPEAPDHSRRARQRARDGALSRARALRPRTAARLTPAGAPPSGRGGGRCAAFSRLHPLRCRRQPRQQCHYCQPSAIQRTGHGAGASAPATSRKSSSRRAGARHGHCGGRAGPAPRRQRLAPRRNGGETALPI